MSATNKYGELEGGKCPECSDPIKPQWVACPACGAILKTTQQVKKAPDLSHDRFKCPGCDERATAAEFAVLCKECDAFVHRDCTVKGKETKPYRGGGLFGETQYSENERLCPICKSVLGEWH